MSETKMNSTTAFSTTLTATAGSNTYQLPETSKRIGLKVKNGAGNLNLVFGGEASANFGYPMDPNEKLDWDHPESCPKAYISFFCTVATTLSILVTTEGQGV